MDDSDDDFGPAPQAGEGAIAASAAEPGPTDSSMAPTGPHKRRRYLEHEESFIAALSSASQYEKSYMHRYAFPPFITALFLFNLHFCT